MKSKTDDVLGEYRNADLTRRLHLFLAYRDLRHEFIQVDRIECLRQADLKESVWGRPFRRLTGLFEGVRWHCPHPLCCGGGRKSSA